MAKSADTSIGVINSGNDDLMAQIEKVESESESSLEQKQRVFDPLSRSNQSTDSRQSTGLIQDELLQQEMMFASSLA